MLIRTKQTCFGEGMFEKKKCRGRTQFLALMSGLLSCRPLCFLNTLGKILKGIIANRLLEIAENGLCDMRFGFRKRHRTLDTIQYDIKVVVDILTPCTVETVAGVKRVLPSSKYRSPE